MVHKNKKSRNIERSVLFLLFVIFINFFTFSSSKCSFFFSLFLSFYFGLTNTFLILVALSNGQFLRILIIFIQISSSTFEWSSLLTAGLDDSIAGIAVADNSVEPREDGVESDGDALDSVLMDKGKETADSVESSIAREASIGVVGARVVVVEEEHDVVRLPSEADLGGLGYLLGLGALKI